MEIRLNFTVKRVPPPERSWGATIEGGDPANASHWTGAVGLLARGEGDLSAVGLTIAEDRAQVPGEKHVYLFGSLSHLKKFVGFHLNDYSSKA